MSELAGVLPMLVTPFDANGDVALDELTAVAEHQLRHGIGGLSALGLAGEAGSLTVDERAAITQRVVEVAAGAPVVIGCSAPDTETTTRLAAGAADAGAAAVMIAPPVASSWSRDELLDHYAQVAERVDPTPVMVQDAPTMIGVALDPEFVVDLARAHANVRHAKPESVPAADAVAALAGVDDISVFGGHGGLYLPEVLEAGADGVIPGCEHPAGFVEIVEAWRAGDRARAREAFRRLLPLLVWEFQSLDCFIASVKTVLLARGLISRPLLRGGSWPLGPRSQEILLRRAKEAGALEGALCP